MELFNGERLDYVNDRLSLIQKTDGLTFGTDALLLAGYVAGKHKRGMEIGGGSGIISLLLLTREKVGQILACEVQEEYCRLIERNAVLNSLADRLEARHTDVRELSCGEEFDIVFSNPPYMKATSGALNKNDAKTVARHEIHGDIGELIRAGARALRYGGAMYVVWRPDRLTELIYAMHDSGIEAKRMTFVHADEKSEPSMVLVEGKKGAKPTLNVTRPLIIYKNSTHNEYSADMNYILENGSFGAEYKR
ncbi:MAG: methyltransferase [Clostridia bacterium]|nr:methyltransferase [Clostridia bacterium]